MPAELPPRPPEPAFSPQVRQQGTFIIAFLIIWAFDPHQAGLPGFAALAIVASGVTRLSDLIVQLLLDDSKR
jgi:hypothetical protein